MAMDMFLEIDGIKGEAQDKTHKDQIDILSWSWGMSNSGTTHMGSGSGSGKVNVQDISFTKFVDSSTPALMLHCCNGKHIKSAKLTVRKSAGDSPLEYIVINLTDLIVTCLTTGGSGGEDRLTENLTLNFAEVKFEYFVQDKKGVGKSAGVLNWNVPQNASK